MRPLLPHLGRSLCTVLGTQLQPLSSCAAPPVETNLGLAWPLHPVFFAWGARGVSRWGGTPRACRWRLWGQLEPGVWRAAARLQTFSFCKSRARGSPLSAAARCSLLPRAGELLYPTLAASFWEARTACGDAAVLATSCALYQDRVSPPQLWKPLVSVYATCNRRWPFFGGREGIPRSRHPLPRDSHTQGCLGRLGGGGEGVSFLQIVFVSSSCSENHVTSAG